MEYIAVFSKENLCLAKEELFGVLEAQNVKYSIRSDFGEAVVFEAEKEGIDFGNMSHTHEIGLCIGDADDISGIDLEKYSAYIKSPINVRVVKASSGEIYDRMEIEKSLGAFFAGKGYKIDLKNPKTSFRVYIPGGKRVLGVLLKAFYRSEFNKRMPVKRPFFHPVSLKPRIARAMCNIARVSKGKNVLDPFVGTGGLLMEAALMGANVFGVDIKKEMIEGAALNFRHYNIPDFRLECGNTFEMSDFFGKVRFDCIITDLPYGRNTKLKVSPAELGWKFLEKLLFCLKRDAMLLLQQIQAILRYLKT